MKLKGNWKRLGGVVFESTNGSRVHMLGMIMTSDLKLINMASEKYREQFDLCLKLCGHNKKRALMLMAENVSLNGAENVKSMGY